MKSTRYFTFSSFCLLVSITLPGCAVSRSESFPVEVVTPTATPTPSDKWGPAIFEGIRVGEDDRSVAIKILGKPFGSGPPEDQDPEKPEIWDEFRINGDVHDRVTVMSLEKTGRIIMIISHPKELTIDKAKAIFGQDYEINRYSIVPCEDDPSDGPLQLSTDGEFKFVEYREKGIAITLDYSGKLVQDIEYRSEPIGASKAHCDKNANDEDGS